MMAVPIQRVAGPQPTEERNGEFNWTIPLSATPSRAWLKFFNTPSELTGACRPSLVSFHQRDMVFAAREDQIKSWVQSIDQWIAMANERAAAAEAGRDQILERQQRGVEETKSRLTEADKYRDL
jgi:hypothetical protein